MVLEMVIVAQLATATAYRSERSQTDDTPLYTANNEHVAPGGCAVSRDIERTAPLGSYLYIEGVGICRVNDRMGNTHRADAPVIQGGTRRLSVPQRRGVDLWKATYKEEKAFGVKKARVYRIVGPRIETAMGVTQ